MNIFFFDMDPVQCAQYHCDKHVIKMILEHSQMLCSTIHRNGRAEDYTLKLYRPTHLNHPSTLWVNESRSNAQWLIDLTAALNDEYRYRYDKNNDHKSFTLLKQLKFDFLPDIPMTTPALAMPDEYKTNDPIESYRSYFRGTKQHIAQWSKRAIPHWYSR